MSTTKEPQLAYGYVKSSSYPVLLAGRWCILLGWRKNKVSEKKNEGEKKVTTWTEIVAFDEGILKKGGSLTEDDIKTMARLFDTLDESTLPEGVKFPLGYEGDEKERA